MTGARLDHLDVLAQRLRGDAERIEEVRARVTARVEAFVLGATELRPRLEDHDGALASLVHAAGRLCSDVVGVRDALADADRAGLIALAGRWELVTAPVVERLSLPGTPVDVAEVWRHLGPAARGAGELPSGPAGLAAGRMWTGVAAAAPRVQGAADVVGDVLRSPAMDAAGRALGAMGAVGDGMRAVRALDDGDHAEAAYDGAKAVLGVAALVPGPVGVAATALSLGVLVYENREAIADGVGRGLRGARRLVDGLF